MDLSNLNKLKYGGYLTENQKSRLFDLIKEKHEAFQLHEFGIG